MVKTCSTCGFAKNGNFCPILKTTINLTEDTCPLHQEQLRTCPICGQVMLKNSEIFSPELNIWVCNQCGPHLYTCATCKNRHNDAPRCVIEQYHGDKSVLIQVTQRQGMFTMTSTQLNPEVLDEVCITCTCGSPWNCQRNHKCNNWEACI